MRKFIGAAVIIAMLLSGGILIGDICGVGGGDRRVDLKITEGESTSAIISELKQSGMISSKLAFKLYAKKTGNHIYKTGIHSLNSSMSYSEILKALEQVPKQDSDAVTIPEGYELRQIADLLEKEGLINRDVFMRETESGSFNYDFIGKIPKRDNRLEGYLFPDTYSFTADMTEHDIIDKMLENFNKQIVPAYEKVQPALSLDEIVTLASMIEREAAGNEDRGKVASVFVNRLNRGMKLESCATVQYVLKERKSVLSNGDTQIDSPYNTYKNSGLPIGPIASPGLKSVEAALYPEQTNYLYFMASADGKSTVFSETFDGQLEHQKEIQGGN